KCGTTWMQYIVYLLMNGARPLPPGRKLEEFFPHLEEVGTEGVTALAGRRLIKTHLPFEMTPFHGEARYVYVARNPFDCAVSFYHRTRGFVHHYDFADGTFDDFFECFILGEVDFGDYFDHLASWYAQRRAPNVLFVTYERMQEDIEGVIAEVAEFVGEPASSAARDPSMVAAIREEVSFGRMSRDQRRWSSARPAGMPEFVRKGIVGDWRAAFSPQQARRLRDEFVRRTGGTGPYRLWPEILADVDAYAVGAG